VADAGGQAGPATEAFDATTPSPGLSPTGNASPATSTGGLDRFRSRPARSATRELDGTRGEGGDGGHEKDPCLDGFQEIPWPPSRRCLPSVCFKSHRNRSASKRASLLSTRDRDVHGGVIRAAVGVSVYGGRAGKGNRRDKALRESRPGWHKEDGRGLGRALGRERNPPGLRRRAEEVGDRDIGQAKRLARGRGQKLLVIRVASA